MIQDPEIPGHDLVLEDGTGWNIDAIAVIRDNDHRSSEHDTFSERDIAGDRKVIEL